MHMCVCWQRCFDFGKSSSDFFLGRASSWNSRSRSRSRCLLSAGFDSAVGASCPRDFVCFALRTTLILCLLVKADGSSSFSFRYTRVLISLNTSVLCVCVSSKKQKQSLVKYRLNKWVNESFVLCVFKLVRRVKEWVEAGSLINGAAPEAGRHIN